MNLSYSLLLFLLSVLSSFSPTPSAAQSSDSTNSSTSSSNSSATTNSTASPTTTSFANLTTTNAQGSTIITSVPITIVPSMTPTTSSSTAFPSLTGFNTCVTDCLTDAVAQVNCTSITAVACYCTNQTFPAALYSCVAANCSSSVPPAEALAQRFCAIDSTTLSFASTVGPSTSSPYSTTTNPAATNTNAFNAAPAAPWRPDARGWTGMALAACGAVFGAALL
ncbi:hypothetical protein DFH94DRAFT_680168 [Russula ochroleuca]|uniref:CFEM domain-containing protein n=1 Tax=Russula ochroleuca TaxID=152965 RepID=A0A9P5N196_9AGAM|nr:hypothetical protein DFH94DRAFT_680168 [Russula ochroleuca]